MDEMKVDDKMDHVDVVDMNEEMFRLLHFKCIQENVCACGRWKCSHNRKYWASLLFYIFKTQIPSHHLKCSPASATANVLEIQTNEVEKMWREVKQEVHLDTGASLPTSDDDIGDIAQSFDPSALIGNVFSRSRALIKEQGRLRSELNVAEAKNKRLKAVHQSISLRHICVLADEHVVSTVISSLLNNDDSSDNASPPPPHSSLLRGSLQHDEAWRLIPLDLELSSPLKSKTFKASSTLSGVPLSAPVVDRFIVILKQIEREDTRGYFFGVQRQDVEYLTRIRYPLNLDTILQRIQNVFYPNVGAILKDIDMVWANCYLFHGKATLKPGCPARYAQRLQWMLDSYVQQLIKERKSKGQIY